MIHDVRVAFICVEYSRNSCSLPFAHTWPARRPLGYERMVKGSTVLRHWSTTLQTVRLTIVGGVWVVGGTVYWIDGQMLLSLLLHWKTCNMRICYALHTRFV